MTKDKDTTTDTRQPRLLPRALRMIRSRVVFLAVALPALGLAAGILGTSRAEAAIGACYTE